ncbi:MAG: fibronectin type III domain-containing protein [Acidobacteria bacterium]|nr:fibronectin type III domain-containing protein [Acidobacteriota bacterium]
MFLHRRRFLRSGPVAGLPGLVGHPVLGQGVARPPENFRTLGAPVVQAPTGTSAAVAWAVNDTSTGWIEYGETEELGQVAFGTNEGLQPLDAFVHKVRIEGLQPGTKYFYRTVSVPIAFMGPYDIRRGRPFESATHHELAVTMRKLDGTTIGTYTYGRRAS